MVVKFASDEYEMSRVKNYETTLESCKCLAFKFRRQCRHISWLSEQQNKLFSILDNMKFLNGINCNDFSTLYGEETLQKMKIMGVAYEKGGKLYKLE